MTKIYFGHCIGCDQPIRPPYLSFVVSVSHAPDGGSVSSWEDADICDDCAAKLTARDLHRLVSAEETEEEDSNPRDAGAANNGPASDK